MGGKSPAKVLRSVVRMTKFLERKEYSCSKPLLTMVVLPGVNILPVLPTQTVQHVQSRNVLPQSQPLPSSVSDQPHHDVSSENLDVDQAELYHENAAIPPGIGDILTKRKFFEIMNKFQEDLFKPI